MVARNYVSTHGKLIGLLNYQFFIARATYAEGSVATAALVTSLTQRVSYTMSPKKCLGSRWIADEDFFRFTRGRFIYNEKDEMSKRYVRFDMQELARIAAEAVGSKSCIGMEKYPDGMYNKALLLTMDDGAQVVAKVPNPNAGRPHLTTASEVATMEFVGVIDPYHQFTAKINLADYAP